MDLFRKSVPENSEKVNNFCRARKEGEAVNLQDLLSDYLKKACQEALYQITDRHYQEQFLEEGIAPEHIIKYGIAFYL